MVLEKENQTNCPDQKQMGTLSGEKRSVQPRILIVHHSVGYLFEIQSNPGRLKQHVSIVPQ